MSEGRRLHRKGRRPPSQPRVQRHRDAVARYPGTAVHRTGGLRRRLRGGFNVNTKIGGHVGFGIQLVEHLKHHSKADQRRRKRLLPYAIKTVTSGKRTANPQGGKGSWKYAQWFEDSGLGLLVLTDAHGDVEDFDIIPKERRSA